MIWLNDDFQQMRMRHEWRINGQLVRPWRLSPSNPVPATIGLLIDKFYNVSISGKGKVVVWDGKDWELKEVRNVNRARFMPDFLPLEGQRFNPKISVVYTFPVGATGVFNYVILQEEGFQDEDELYMCMRYTSFVAKGTNEKTAEDFFFSYNSDFNPLPLRKMTQERIKALGNAINGYPLTFEEKQILNIVSPEVLLQQGRQMWVENNLNHGIALMQRVFDLLTRQVQHAHDNDDISSYYEAAYCLGEAYYEKGLLNKALYYLELSQGVQQEGDIDVPLVHKCKLRTRDFRISNSLADYPSVGEWTGLSLTRWTMLLRTCFDLVPDDLASMLIVIDGNTQKGIKVNGNEIFDFPIFKIVRSHDVKLVQAYIALKDGRMAVFEFRTGANISFSGVITQFFESEGPPKVINMGFGWDNWVAQEDFLKERNRLSNLLIEEKTLTPLEMLWLGSCENAHLCMVRAEAALRAQANGDAVFFLLQGYQEIISHLGTDKLDHFDLQLIGCLCHSLGFAYSVMGLHEQAISYLIKLEKSENILDIVELAICLSQRKDIRALSFLNKQIVRQSIYKANPSQKNGFNIEALRLLRQQRVKILKVRNRIDQLKWELGSMICDTDEALRVFAYSELANLVNEQQG